MSDYPDYIVERATDPRTGVASVQKFLPSIAEIKSYCDAEAQRFDRRSNYDQRVEEQLRLRTEWNATRNERKLTYDELKAKYGDGQGGWIGEGGTAKRAYTEEEKAAFVESAKEAAKALNGMKLSAEAQAILHEQDEFRELNSGEIP